MYAKSIIEYVQAHAVANAWSRHLIFVPVVMALGVAAMPFTLKAPAIQYEQPRAQSGSVLNPQVETLAASDNPFTGLVQASVVTAPKRTALPLDAQQRAIAGYIKRKYGVSTDVVQELVRTAFAAGKRYGVDPLLVVAIMAVESGYNPIAESFAGAKGLMQIIPKYHLEKFEAFGGEQSVFDPRVNILVGARILREYLLMHSGDLLTALQTYAGALADRDAVYTQRVLNEKDQLDALAGFPKTERKNRILMALEPERPGALNLPAPKLNLQTDLTPATPAAVPLPAVPAGKSADEAAHTPPTQPPATQPSVNLTQAADALRF
jgi:soluble lytic murein transglycosylase-like protein